MKLLIIGCGQCGGRIADEFARLNVRARVQRKIELVTGIFAVNTDIADLTGLSRIKRDYQHRILIGSQKSGGHGVGKINELGAEIAREDGDKIIDAIRATPQFPETDAFLLISGAAGGTGSGAIPVLTRQIKERFSEKLVYNLIVLPFRHEELTEGRAIYNTATCLKSAYLVADAVILVDNQRYIRKDSPVQENLNKINSMVVEPFYDLLCAGEEKKPEYIGAKILDAGDIIQTLAGWTVIGHGKAQIPRFSFLFGGRSSFREKGVETNRGIQALQEAVSELSLKCRPADAKRGLYLLSASAKEIGMEMVVSIGESLKRLAPEAILRSGDYPRGRSSVDVIVVLSELSYVAKVMDYFTKAINYLYATRMKREGLGYERKTLEDAVKDLPSLL